MINKSFIISFLLVLFSINSLSAAFKIDIYNAYLKNDMTKWKLVVDKMEKKTEFTDKVRLELVNYLYGYIGYCIEEDKETDAKKYLDRAEKHLDVLEKTASNSSQVSAYRSIFYGFEISMSTWRAAILGPKSMEQAKKAIKDDPQNANAYIQYANILRKMPSAFGGSVEDAIKNYKKALTLMEKKPFSLKSNWNYLALLKSIGESYEELNDYPKAKQYYEKALKKEPKFTKVKNDLLPKVKAKIKE